MTAREILIALIKLNIRTSIYQVVLKILLIHLIYTSIKLYNGIQPQPKRNIYILPKIYIIANTLLSSCSRKRSKFYQLSKYFLFSQGSYIKEDNIEL